MENKVTWKIREPEREFSMCLLNHLKHTPVDFPILVATERQTAINCCSILLFGTYGNCESQQSNTWNPFPSLHAYLFKFNW